MNKTYIDDVIKVRATVENIAIYILKKLSDVNHLYSVTVWEGMDKYAKILMEEINK